MSLISNKLKDLRTKPEASGVWNPTEDFLAFLSSGQSSVELVPITSSVEEQGFTLYPSKSMSGNLMTQEEFNEKLNIIKSDLKN